MAISKDLLFSSNSCSANLNVSLKKLAHSFSIFFLLFLILSTLHSLASLCLSSSHNSLRPAKAGSFLLAYPDISLHSSEMISRKILSFSSTPPCVNSNSWLKLESSFWQPAPSGCQAASEHVVLKDDVLEVGKMGKCKDLSEFDKSPDCDG